VHPCSPTSNTYRESIWLEAELDTGLVPEVALVVVAMLKAISKARQQVSELRWSNGDVFPHRDVDASTDQEIKRIVARRATEQPETMQVL
jgi:hypothetical protein